jgi:hypothetical protein
MKCPKCKENIGVFTKTVNTWNKERLCPHCQAKIEVYMPAKGQALMFGALVSLITLDDLIESYIGVLGLVFLSCVVGGYTAISSLSLRLR